MSDLYTSNIGVKKWNLIKTVTSILLICFPVYGLFIAHGLG